MAARKYLNYKQFEALNVKFVNSHDRLCPEVGFIQRMFPQDDTCIIQTPAGVFDCSIGDLIAKVQEGRFGVTNPQVLYGYGCLV